MNEAVKVVLLVAGAAIVLLGSTVLVVSVLPSLHPGTSAAGGALVALAGAVLVLYAAMQTTASGDPAPAGAYPVTVDAVLDEPLSRWLWLVKWILALPHMVILAFLWVAALIVTIAAFVTVVATGRYPRPLFTTNVGIVRWSWRVGFYAYSVLGTDRYPPFSLADADYPARLLVAYPEHLARGLALVKWWLLALPHYLIVGLFINTTWDSTSSNGGPQTHFALAPLLVSFAAIGLLFTGRYPRGIFDLVVGMHRWAYRVLTYVAFMHDAYPPFRLDMGGSDPASVPLAVQPLVDG
jgi:hypothetical protein